MLECIWGEGWLGVGRSGSGRACSFTEFAELTAYCFCRSYFMITTWFTNKLNKLSIINIHPYLNIAQIDTNIDATYAWCNLKSLRPQLFINGINTCFYYVLTRGQVIKPNMFYSSPCVDHIHLYYIKTIIEEHITIS